MRRNPGSDIFMNTFNLVESPWIPVRYLDGQNALVSLETAFRESTDIADLDCPPHERISLVRLLVCITQAELGAPETPDDWEGFGDDLESRAPAYLRRPDIFPHFNLFGDGPRFLQVEGLVPDANNRESTSWIIFHLATNNNYTLFDHQGGKDREQPANNLARSILAFQNFSPPIGKHTEYGFCSEKNALHTLLLGGSLKDTIILNCLDSESISNNYRGGMGSPVWETSGATAQNARESYLNRLVPLHRKLWFEDRTTLLKDRKGIHYPNYKDISILEFSECVVTEKDVRFLLRADPSKKVWRDLLYLTVERTATSNDPHSPPLNLQSHIIEFEERDRLDIWAGALVFENTASLVMTLESTATIPSALLSSDGRRVYQAAVEWAGRGADLVKKAVSDYYRDSEAKSKTPEKQIPMGKALTTFWTALDQQFERTLLPIIQNRDLRSGLSFGEGPDPWTVAVRRAAREAYNSVCPRQTPRQLQAYAAGLKVLNPKPKKKK